MIYDLYAVVNHRGNLGHGHYTALCKNDNSWHCFNDKNVTPIEKKDIITENAYLLFYRKKL